jgi:pantoate--beta-alanine ligase
MLTIVADINEWRKIRQQLGNKSIGFVPTMGHLHVGHLNLCQQSKSNNDITVASVFVNPTQFNQAQDFDQYPRTIEQDKVLLESMAVDYLLVPSADGMYPDGYQIKVTETELSKELEGEHRPGHFDGMLTVVLKLLNVVQPTRAYFGEKDYQQYLLVKKMAEALLLQTEIIGCETIRADSGLALSSRNSRLSAEQLEKAVGFATQLTSSQSVEQIIANLVALGFKVDYVAEKWGRRLGAVWLGNVRLIDNVPI